MAAEGTGSGTGTNNAMSTEALKAELAQYLQKRKESNADESARSQVGKIVGGTKGNAILDFVSGVPNKERVIEDVPDVFDYSELEKYGFNRLVVPIMDAGGRREMYALMGMTAPASRIKKTKKARALVIDRTGETDKARYSGLKVMQALDDDEMGRKLEESMRNRKEGKLRDKLEEETYVMPFADKRNIGPAQTPDWTAERLDEEGRKAGQAQAWARKARAGEFKGDPYEILTIEGGLQVYSILTTLFTAFSFGGSTRTLLVDILHEDANEMNNLLNLLQGPALALVLASIGSCIFCGTTAPGKNRNAFVWGVKGFAGGPLALLQLRNLESLVTRGEADEAERMAKQA